MKNFIYIIALAGVVFSSCNRDLFETNPADQLSTQQVLSDAAGAQSAMNGTYRSLYSSNWGTSWQSEHPGLAGFTLANSLMCEDNVMYGYGNGWFWYDYEIYEGAISNEGDYTSTAGRQYSHWQMFYTTISQCNFVLSNRAELEGSAEGKSVIGQALALRGFMYLCLSENFCQGNYPENKNTPGVPLYLEPTGLDTPGKGRGLLSDVLSRAAQDLDDAIAMFDGASAQAHPSHIDVYAAHGLRARVAMVTGEWNKVSTHAKAGLAKPGLSGVLSVGDLGGLNNANAADVLWAFAVNAENAALYGGFFSYMDAEGGTYAKNGMQQLIDMRLYNLIPDTDDRKTFWWNGELSEDEENPDGSGSMVSYCNLKFKVKNAMTAEADIINLRAEELVLMAAEAACVQSYWAEARQYLNQLGSARDSEYATRLASMSDAATYGDDTMAPPTTLREEILFQRRVELWTEGMGRSFDLRRLHLGFSRADSNHNDEAGTYPAGYPYFVYLLPQTEFINNEALDESKDQNPR